MKNLTRLLLLTLLGSFLLTSCASYKPLIDTAGKSGTFNEDKAKEISNDIQHCKQIAKENTNLVSNFSFGLCHQLPKHNTKTYIESV